MKRYNVDIIVIPGPKSFKLFDEVYFGGQKFIEMQKELFSMQNKSINLRWNIGILNEQSDETHNYEKDDNTRFFNFQFNQLNVKYKKQPSSQHGSLLNNVIKKIVNDHFQYVLIIDPDFFVFTDNWAGRLIEYMTRRQLSIIGASYPETDARYYFDFPTAYFSLIDTARMPLNELNYLPDENQFATREDEPWEHGFSLEVGNYKATKIRFFLNHEMSKTIISFFLWRNKKNVFRDTGWEIRKKFKKKCRHEEFLYVNFSDLKYSQGFTAKKRELINGVDVEWYLNTYDDVKKAKIDPVLHYLKYGKFEGRSPSAGNKNQTDYIGNIRPHTKLKFLLYLERFFPSEFSILFKRTYSMDNFIQDYNSNLGLFNDIPPASAYYFFFNDFVALHLGHSSKKQKPEEIKKIIFDTYFKLRSRRDFGASGELVPE